MQRVSCYRWVERTERGMSENGQRPAAVACAGVLRAHPHQPAGDREARGLLPTAIVCATLSVAGSMRATVVAELVGDPDPAGSDRDGVGAGSDGNRRGDLVCLRVDPRDGSVEAVGDPHRALSHRDRGRSGPDVDRVGDLIGLRVYPQHLSVGSSLTHTAPGPTATSVGLPPSGIVACSAPVVALIRVSVPSLLLATHTDP